MKKWRILFLALAMLCSLAACGGEKQTGGTPAPTAAPLPVELESSPAPEPTPASDTETEGKTLIAYFSATNNTEGIANHINALLDADLYEIVPETPYTTADLDWHDSSSRTTVEMNDDTARPAISGSVEDMDSYDTIFLGYPIWWGEAPRIICTFLESYDFNGKTIVPFCTSNSSGIGSSGTNLHDLTDGANWMEGRRFSAGAAESDVQSWLDGLELAG